MQIKSKKAAARIQFLSDSRNSHSKHSLMLTTVLFPLIALLAALNPAHAKTMDDRFQISLGGYELTRYESSMSLTDKNTGVGVSISPDDSLGIETENTTVLRIDGHFRFNRRHALTYSWYSIRRSGYRTLTREVNWVDENGDPITIPVGATISTSLNYDIYKLGYLWSFYTSEKVDLAAGAGLHTTRIAVGITTDTTSSGIDAKSVKSTVPLPVLSFGLTYRLTPKFRWYMKTEAFTLSIGEWDGIYSDQTLGLEYKPFKNFGVGAGFGSNALNLTVETNDSRFKFANRISGLLLYVVGSF